MRTYSLNELVNINRPITYGIVQPGPDVSPNGVPLIRGKDYSSGKISLDGLYHVLPEIDKPYARSKVMSGDILLSIAGYVGQVAIVPYQLEGANITQTTARLSCDENVIISRFLFYVLHSEKFQRTQVKRFEKGSAQSGLNLADVATFQVEIPELPQQRKIAKILSTCDTVIAKTEEAIAKYQAIKQGMMHDLFTRGILQEDYKYKDKNGTWVELSRNQLRPKYQDAPELYKDSELGMIPKDWEVKRLEDIANEVILGTTLRGANSDNIPILKMGNLLWGELNLDKIELIDKALAADNLILKNRDFLFNTRNTPDLVGKTVIWRNELPESTFDNNLLRIRFSSQAASPWISWYMSMGYGKNKLKSIVDGTTSVAAIYWKNLRNYCLPLAPIEEQEASIKRLDSIISKIKYEESTLSKYHQIKSGLMQDLLSGKVEVSVSEEEEIINA